MATTDAISVACKQLGIGADIYFANDRTKYDAVGKIGGAKVEALESKCKTDGVDITKLCAIYKVKDLVDLTEIQHKNAIDHWKDVVARCKP